MTWRRLRVLVDQLPPESATKSALRDAMSAEEWEQATERDAPAGWGAWSHEALLLAQVADRVAQVEWALIAVNSEKGKAPKAPAPIVRPGVGLPPQAAAQRERAEAIKRVAFLKALERNHGGHPTDEQVAEVMAELGAD